MTSAPRYNLVIFDCDGVLIDSEVLSCTALVECLRRHGIDIGLEAALDRFLGRTPQAVSDYCATLDRRLPETFPAELRAAVRTAFAGRLTAIADAHAHLQMDVSRARAPLEPTSAGV